MVYTDKKNFDDDFSCRNQSATDIFLRAEKKGSSPKEGTPFCNLPEFVRLDTWIQYLGSFLYFGGVRAEMLVRTP